MSVICITYMYIRPEIMNYVYTSTAFSKIFVSENPYVFAILYTFVAKNT